jgi:hypothetical protein
MVAMTHTSKPKSQQTASQTMTTRYSQCDSIQCWPRRPSHNANRVVKLVRAGANSLLTMQTETLKLDKGV